eukprot:9488942-Pyramimonas_sp.AAC.1
METKLCGVRCGALTCGDDGVLLRLQRERLLLSGGGGAHLPLALLHRLRHGNGRVKALLPQRL